MPADPDSLIKHSEQLAADAPLERELLQCLKRLSRLLDPFADPVPPETVIYWRQNAINAIRRAEARDGHKERT